MLRESEAGHHLQRVHSSAEQQGGNTTKRVPGTQATSLIQTSIMSGSNVNEAAIENGIFQASKKRQVENDSADR